jgi:predicted transcriptional regulator YheO
MATRTQSEIIELLNNHFPKPELLQIVQTVLQVSKPTAYKYLSKRGIYFL